MWRWRTRSWGCRHRQWQGSALEIEFFDVFLLNWETWRQNPMALLINWTPISEFVKLWLSALYRQSFELKFSVEMTRSLNLVSEDVFLRFSTSMKAMLSSGRRGRRCSSWLATSLRPETGETQGTDSSLVGMILGRRRNWISCYPIAIWLRRLVVRFAEGVTNCSRGKINYILSSC